VIHTIQIENTVSCSDVKPELIKKLTAWILQTSDHQNPWSITFVFTDDSYIINLNVRFFNTSNPTDVISFNLSDSEDSPEGEIYISVDTAARHAEEYHVSLENELFRLVAHGVYHLIGYDDDTPEQKYRMTELEDKALFFIDKEQENY